MTVAEKTVKVEFTDGAEIECGTVAVKQFRLLLAESKQGRIVLEIKDGRVIISRREVVTRYNYSGRSPE
jgi:hypothetical protein